MLKGFPMAAHGYLAQRPAKATSLGFVIGLHAAVIGGLVLMKGPEFIRDVTPDLKVIDVKTEPPPPPEPVPPQPSADPPISRPLDVTRQIVPTPQPNTVPTPTPTPSVPPSPYTGAATVPQGPSGPPREIAEYIPPRLPAHNPVRTEALFDPRYAGDLQPPYPVSEERAEREGTVRLRVSIAASGRVTAVQRLGGSDAFFRATERHALSRWRFRPATIDGRPVESSKTLSVHFRLDGR